MTGAASDRESHEPTPPEGLREKILEAARALVVEMTFENVRMRDLAARSGVALNTLYRYFPNKTSVLHDAVVEFFAKAYSDIAAQSFDHGIDKVVHILDGVAEWTRTHNAYAKSLGPRLVSRYNVWSLGQIRFRSYLPAITQIRDEGDLAEHADVTLLTSLICRQITAVYVSWSNGELASDTIPDISKLMVGLTLRGISRGYTRRKCEDIICDGMGKYRNTVFY